MSAELRVLVFGDSGDEGEQQKNVALAMENFCSSHPTDFGLILGDIFYETGASSVDDKIFERAFENFYGAFGFPFYVVLGNHDLGCGMVERSYDPYIEYGIKNPNSSWRFPKRFYSFSKNFDGGRIEFFAVDSNCFDTQQQIWLKHSLDISHATEMINNERVWRVVFAHHPVFSFGLHGDNEDLIKNLFPILKGKVDLYLAGHEHDQQIISLPDGNQPLFVVSGTAARLRPCTWGTTGRGGSQISRLTPQSIFRRTEYAESQPGFLSLLVRADELVVEVRNTEVPDVYYARHIFKDSQAGKPSGRSCAQEYFNFKYMEF